MSRVSSLWAEFKAFAFKGNMIELAVAVVIGTAFSAVITSLVHDVIMPGISYVVTGVKETAEATSIAAGKAKDAIIPASQPATNPATEPTTQASTVPTTEPTTVPAVAEIPPAEAALVRELVKEMKDAAPAP